MPQSVEPTADFDSLAEVGRQLAADIVARRRSAIGGALLISRRVWEQDVALMHEFADTARMGLYFIETPARFIDAAHR